MTEGPAKLFPKNCNRRHRRGITPHTVTRESLRNQRIPQTTPFRSFSASRGLWMTSCFQFDLVKLVKNKTHKAWSLQSATVSSNCLTMNEIHWYKVFTTGYRKRVSYLVHFRVLLWPCLVPQPHFSSGKTLTLTFALFIPRTSLFDKSLDETIRSPCSKPYSRSYVICLSMRGWWIMPGCR